MAWALDFINLRRLIGDGVVEGPVLEIGSFNHQAHDEGNAKVTCERAGLAWEGADIAPGPGVDRVFDVLERGQLDAIEERWATVLLFNLLEHVYDPVQALRNAATLLRPGGCLVVSGPAIWELHDFPGDFWRPMPGFYFEHARREGLTVIDGSPTWLVNDRLIPYDALRDGDQRLAPSNRFIAAVTGARMGRWIRIVDGAGARLGRTQFMFPSCSFAIALRRS